MSSQTNADDRNDSSGRRAFPDKANPNRPPRGREAAKPRGPRDGGRYPEKCEPNHARTPLTENQRELAVKYLPLAQGIARQLKTPAAEGDELKSTAYLALVEAARTFDPARNVNFATYAQHRIRGALLDSRRYWRYGECRPGVADPPVFQRLGSSGDIHGCVIGKEPEQPVGTDLEAIDVVESRLRRLPRVHALACRMIYLDGKSQDEAAAVLGCSKSYFSRLHRDAVEWLGRDYRDSGSIGGRALSEVVELGSSPVAQGR